jgi:arylsulfatase A-like enzyme
MATTDVSPRRIPKNVLVIVLDDIGTDKLSLFDPNQSAPPYARTPRLQELAESGIRFTSVYANPYCSPTRASIQTGRYPLRTGMGANAESYQLPDSEVLLAKLLKEGLPPSQA